MWIIGQKIFSDKNILPIKTANIFGKQYFTNKHVLAGKVLDVEENFSWFPFPSLSLIFPVPLPFVILFVTPCFTPT
jgi:hypothetical protein